MSKDPISEVALSRSDLSGSWARAGFRFGDKGTHTSRTMMLQELTLVLEAAGPNASRGDYISAIIDLNCLGKQTVATRKLSAQRLSELYSLDPAILIFRILRALWQSDSNGRPLLALLAALARDPLLRVTAIPVLQTRPGEELARQTMIDALRESVEHRLNDQTLDKVVRNASSSWAQSGHLKGRVRKIRQKVKPTSMVTAYALLLGYILGARSSGLFDTFWARVLDEPAEELISLTNDAKRLGLLDVRQAGGVIDISFSRLLTENERQLIHGTN